MCVDAAKTRIAYMQSKIQNSSHTAIYCALLSQVEHSAVCHLEENSFSGSVLACRNTSVRVASAVLNINTRVLRDMKEDLCHLLSRNQFQFGLAKVNSKVSFIIPTF